MIMKVYYDASGWMFVGMVKTECSPCKHTQFVSYLVR